MDSLHEGEAIELGKNGRALLRLPDTSELWVNAETVLHFGRRGGAGFHQPRPRRGCWRSWPSRRRRFPSSPPAGTVRVLGTTFDTDVERDGLTRVSVIEGEVEVTNKKGNAKVGGRQRIEVRRGDRPGVARRMRSAEIDRLTTWTAPIRPASKSAHRVPHTHRRKGQRDNGILVEVLDWNRNRGIDRLGGGVVFRRFRTTDRHQPSRNHRVIHPWPLMTPDQNRERRRAQGAEVPEGAIVFNLDHTVGLAWTSTVHVNTDMQVLVPNEPNQNIQQNMTMVIDAEVTDLTP